MRGHIGYRIKPQPPIPIRVSNVTVDVITYAPPLNEMRVTHAELDVMTYAPQVEEVRVTHVELDVLTY